MKYTHRDHAQVDRDARSARVWDRGGWLSPHTRLQRLQREMTLPTVKALKDAREQEQARRAIARTFGVDVSTIPSRPDSYDPEQIRKAVKAVLAAYQA